MVQSSQRNGKMMLEVYMQRIRAFSNDHKYEPRVRFMLEDIIEMRANRWQPRQPHEEPRATQEIHANSQWQAAEQAAR